MARKTNSSLLLTEFELKSIQPKVIDILKEATGDNNAISLQQIADILFKKGIKTSDNRLKYIVNNIRLNGILPCLISNSDGYYITLDTDEAREYVKSLTNKAECIYSVAKAIEHQIPNVSIFN